MNVLCLLVEFSSTWVRLLNLRENICTKYGIIGMESHVIACFYTSVFRFLVRRLRTYKEVQLMMLMYCVFTIFFMHFTYELYVSRDIFIGFYVFVSCFAGNILRCWKLETQLKCSEQDIYGNIHSRSVHGGHIWEIIIDQVCNQWGD